MQGRRHRLKTFEKYSRLRFDDNKISRFIMNPFESQNPSPSGFRPATSPDATQNQGEIPQSGGNSVAEVVKLRMAWMLEKTRGDWLGPKSKNHWNYPQCAIPVPLFQQTVQSQTEPKTVPPLNEQPAASPAMGPIRIRQFRGVSFGGDTPLSIRPGGMATFPIGATIRTEEEGL